MISRENLLEQQLRKITLEKEKANNIINELEIILKKEREIIRPSDSYNYGVGNTLDYMWYKLQELKKEKENQ